jgi:hypothetical protein
MVKGKQQTVTWHVDDLKSSHVDPKVNNEFHLWCEKIYGSDKVGHVKVVRGNIHDYLAMILDFKTTKTKIYLFSAILDHKNWNRPALPGTLRSKDRSTD